MNLLLLALLTAQGPIPPQGPSISAEKLAQIDKRVIENSTRIASLETQVKEISDLKSRLRRLERAEADGFAKLMLHSAEGKEKTVESSGGKLSSSLDAYSNWWNSNGKLMVISRLKEVPQYAVDLATKEARKLVFDDTNAFPSAGVYKVNVVSGSPYYVQSDFCNSSGEVMSTTKHKRPPSHWESQQMAKADSGPKSSSGSAWSSSTSSMMSSWPSSSSSGWSSSTSNDSAWSSPTRVQSSYRIMMPTMQSYNTRRGRGLFGRRSNCAGGI